LWDLKLTAYQELIESLDYIKGYYNGKVAYISGQLGESKKTTNPSSKDFNAEYAVLRKSVVYGRFLYSKEVEEELNKLVSLMLSYDYEEFDPDEYQGYNAHCSSEVSKCLKFVVERSAVDLELKPSLRAVVINFYAFIKGWSDQNGTYLSGN